MGGVLFASLVVKSAVEIVDVEIKAQPSEAVPNRSPSASDQQDVEARKLEKVFRKYDTLKLDPEQAAARVRNSGRLSLVLADETLELELEPNDMRAADYRAEESRDGGEIRALEAAPIRTFRGRVRGKEQTEARFTIDDATLEGLILINGEKYFVEMKQRHSELAAPTDFLFYKESDVSETAPASCAASVSEKVKQAGEGISLQDSRSVPVSPASGTLALNREIKLATEADYEYVSGLGGSVAANSEILSTLNLIEGVYQNELGIGFSVAYQHTWATPDDPYVSSHPGIALNEFKNHWNGNFTHITRDAAHRWTGKDLDGDVIGSAEISVVCQTPAKAYGMSQRMSGADIKVGITAHELGHNLGATHPDQEVGAGDCSNTIMQSQVGHSRSFCPFSRQQIAAYVSNNASCLAPTFAITGHITAETFNRDVILSLTGPKTRTYAILPFGKADYTLRGLVAGTYTLSASGQFQTLTPASRTVTITDADVTGVDFTSALVRFKVGGRLADANNIGIAGVTVSISTPAALVAQTTSDADGNYLFEVPATRDYRIAPYSPDGFFSPVDRSVTGLSEDRLNLNFVGTMRPKPTPTPSPTPTPTPISGLSGAIAFESSWQGQKNLHVIDANGNNEAVLVNNLYSTSPQWSPDGTRLAFVQNGGIHLADADGSNLRKFTANQFLEASPNWSPDGKRIMYSNTSQIIVSGIDGAIQTQVRVATWYRISWSPDESKIAFVIGNRNGSHIYVMNADGTGQIRLTSGEWIYQDPQWSPDGTKIVFVREAITLGGGSQIMLMNADGSGQTNLTSMGPGYMTPTWSPDGTKIAFSRSGVIYVMNLDGSNETRITNNDRYNSYPTWKAGPASRPAPTPTPTPTPTPPEPPASVFLNTGGTGNYTVGEGSGRLVIKVLRRGQLSSPVSVDFRTNDLDSTQPCNYTSRTALARCDYATTIETLRFQPGETEKTVVVPIIDDAYVEGDEFMSVSLFRPVGTGLGAANGASVIITDNDTAPSANPILATPFFVRQQYLDFLSREPESGEPWSNVLTRCPNVNNDPTCDRNLVSQSFFGSPEFRLKGFFIYNFYRVAFGRLPRYAEIIPDMRNVTGATPEETFAKRAAFPTDFVQQQEFRQLYDSLSHPAYINALLDRYGLQQIRTPDPANPDGGVRVTLSRANLVERLGMTGAQGLTRAQVLRAIVESDEVGAAEYNGAFVAMQYYGYLRRTPEENGYQAWLRVINQDPQNVRAMVNGFMNSVEYRLRFGQP